MFKNIVTCSTKCVTETNLYVYLKKKESQLNLVHTKEPISSVFTHEDIGHLNFLRELTTFFDESISVYDKIRSSLTPKIQKFNKQQRCELHIMKPIP
jgi:hypothetical protein